MTRDDRKEILDLRQEFPVSEKGQLKVINLNGGSFECCVMYQSRWTNGIKMKRAERAMTSFLWLID